MSSGARFPFQKPILFFLLAGLLLAMVVPALAQGNPTAVVNTGALNVRSGPNYTYERVTTLYKGAQVTMLARFSQNHWVRIQASGGVDGWVNSNFLLPSVPIASLPTVGPGTEGPGPAPTPTPQPPPGQGGNPTAVVDTGALNLRSGPGINFGIVGRALNGETLALLGRAPNSSWVKVRQATGTEGWVNSNYLQSNVPIPNLPIIESAAPPAGPAPTGTIATGALNVRGGPGLAYAIITVAFQGQNVSLLGRNENGSWLLVRLTDGAQGWVNASLVNTSVTVSSLTVVGTPLPATRATVTSGALNVRYGPGSNFDVITSLPQGTVVGMVGRNPNGTWVKIQTESALLGWVDARYLNPTVPIANLPILY